MKTIFTFLAVLVAVANWAQGIDDARMNRDLEVAKNILNTLIYEGRASGDDRMLRFFGAGNIQANFIQDYGVIFSMSRNTYAVLSDTRIITGSGSISVSPNDEEEAEKLNQEVKDNFIEVSKIFMTDYADLIGQLKPEHRIMITQKNDALSRLRYSGSGIYALGYGTEEDKPSTLTIELQKSDLISYKQGKINRNQLMDRVKVEDNTNVSERRRDLDLFSDILRSLYKSDLSETYYISSTPPYDVLDNFGVIYNVKVSTFIKGKTSWSGTVAITKSRTDDEMSIKEAKERYQKFKNDFKEVIIQYGRTIRSLETDDILMLNVTVNDCWSCEVPKKITFTVKSSVLRDFDQNKIDLDNAVAQITVKEQL